jgi:death-on-curing protein
MNYLTIYQVLFLHARIVAETGGSQGMHDLGLLESALARPRASFEGVDLYPDLFAKAAALMDSLVHNHAFVDGNKRTAIAAASIFLRQNGWQLRASNAELESFTLHVARTKPSLSEMNAWLEAHSSPLETNASEILT